MSFNLCFDPSGQVLLESSAVRVATLIFLRWKSVADFHLVLTGGNSGIQFAQRLGLEINRKASQPEDLGYDLAQKKLHIWLSDERFVEFGDAQRNDTSVLSGLSKVAITVVEHRTAPPSLSSLSHSAHSYANSLQERLGDQPFDFTVLGLGDDGHLASCFPGEKVVLNSLERTLPIENSPKPPLQRITITLSQLGRSRSIIIFAVGESKRAALINTLEGGGQMPAEILSKFHQGDELMIYTDIFLLDQNYSMSLGEIR